MTGYSTWARSHPVIAHAVLTPGLLYHRRCGAHVVGEAVGGTRTHTCFGGSYQRHLLYLLVQWQILGRVCTSLTQQQSRGRCEGLLIAGCKPPCALSSCFLPASQASRRQRETALVSALCWVTSLPTWFNPHCLWAGTATVGVHTEWSPSWSSQLAPTEHNNVLRQHN